MRIATRLRCTSLLIALSMASLAQAATLPGTAYVGALGGMTSFGNADEFCSQVVAGVASVAIASGVSIQTSCSTDSKSTGMGAFLGINLAPTVAAEVGYTDLGSINYNFRAIVYGPGAYDIVSETGEGKAHAMHLSFVLHTDNAQGANVMGRLGVYKATTDGTITASDAKGISLPVTFSASADNTGTLFGIGATARFSDNLVGRVEFDRFKDVGDENKTFKSDVNLFSLGLAWTFH